MNHYIVALTGASGSIYGLRLCEELLEKSRLTIITSKAAQLVLKEEQNLNLQAGKSSEILKKYFKSDNFDYFEEDNLLAPVCSGSFPNKGMIVIPCSMATLGSIAGGISANLIERTADVTLKENRKLILVPRETPFNQIHLKNLLKVSLAGALIAPAMPAFYHHPQTIDDMVNFVVGKVLDLLEVEHNLFKRWS
jgi:4-hydroxy-3-polyprenylbenzoate decarboxylase